MQRSATENGANWLNLADRVRRTEAEGPGLRYALWVQGCPLRCQDCCNPHMLEFHQAHRVRVEEVVDEILGAGDIEGVTLLGGEPFAQAASLAELARRVRDAGLGVMVFSGFTLEQLRLRADADALLQQTDLLVDGPYLPQQAVSDRRWIGSANQRAHFLTPRYAQLSDGQQGWDPGPNTIELRITGGRLQINGFPHPELAALVEAPRPAPIASRNPNARKSSAATDASRTPADGDAGGRPAE